MLQPVRRHDQHRAGASLQGFFFVHCVVKRSLEDIMHLDHLDRGNDEADAFADLTDGERFDLD
jgi:hypothetical protein